MALTILYRGPLSSCNYDCHYCPFAKRHETAEQLRLDREALERFANWAEAAVEQELAILFTPWGEGLIRPWYQAALARLSHLPHVQKVAIQTNLSCRLDWLPPCNVSRLGLWCTYHPSEVPRTAFLARCQSLQAAGVSFSVGMVGLRESFDELEALRAELPRDVYLWINAYKDEPNYYTAEEIERLQRIDPLFRVNAVRHPSLGLACRAGESAISVDGQGDIRRCHFVGAVLGNLYEPGWERALRPRVCPNATCGCYIGYMHLPHVRQVELFGAGLLERVPQIADWQASSPEKIFSQAGL